MVLYILFWIFPNYNYNNNISSNNWNSYEIIREQILNSKKEIGGEVVKVNYDIKPGGRMSLNSTKQRKDYENIMFVKNVIRNERPQGSYMLTILRVGTSFQRIDMIEIMA